MPVFMTLSKALSVARSLISDGPVTVLRMGGDTGEIAVTLHTDGEYTEEAV
jgi:hypothetical protein